MLKIPRFMREYANYEIKCYQSNKLMRPEAKEIYINAISGAVKDYQKGLITVEETMRIITNPAIIH